MAKKRQRSLLQMQREKLKAQRAAKAKGARNTQIVARGVADMLFGNKKEKGGAIVKRGQGGRPVSQRVKRVRVKVDSPKQLPGKPKPKALPPGKVGGSLVKKGTSALSRALRVGGRLLAGRDDGSGSALLAAKMASDAMDAARGSTAEERNAQKKKESPKPKRKPVNTRGGQGGSRAAVNRKPKEEKPKRQVTKRNRRGRPVAYADVKPAKRGLSNIPPKEGTGKGSPNDKKKVSKVSAPKPKTKPSVSAPKAKSSGGKNPYRAPQGAERKDRMSKALKELKASTARSKARQNAQMPKKPAAKKKMSRNEKNLRRRQGR